ncbi:MAG TPA: hypothetical protein VGK90_11635 [Rhizomicrobium sp.]|jgi:hypothetical protein
MRVISVIACLLWAMMAWGGYDVIVANWHRGYGTSSDIVWGVYLPATMAVASILIPEIARWLGWPKVALVLAILCLLAWLPPMWLIMIVAAV